MKADPKNITLLCLDVDGVMTDGRIYLDAHGQETKVFDIRDGVGIRLWLGLGHEAAIITGRSSNAVNHRASELGVDRVISGSKDKAADITRLLKETRRSVGQCAMLGDDLPDLPALKLAGYPMAVADACAEVRNAAAFTTTAPGGRGAVREAIEHLIKAQGRWDEAIAIYGGSA
jgi:3-deoxy-D-manno-octulosonate 8-phosphate phosphatase (KDO 8-P phosphatase)